MHFKSLCTYGKWYQYKNIRKFNWTRHWHEIKKDATEYDKIVYRLHEIYETRLLPLEEKCLYHDCYAAPVDVQYFLARPSVVCFGQYSTGKTSFLRYILGKDFPGMRVGPEPTTDQFLVLMKGKTDVLIPGNVLVNDPSKHFQTLEKFGQNFLNKLQCSSTNSKVLESITLVDTPGILSGEKQRVQRGYDFENVLEWFFYHADRIILLFDSNKLDISDELRRTIETLRGKEDKLRVVLNKADSLDANSLFRVYGALMWSLGQVLLSPEVIRVYIGSFWDKPKTCPEYYKRIFENEENDLLTDIKNLPKTSLVRKISTMDKRAKQVLVHAKIMNELHSRMPYFQKQKGKEELIKKLDEVFNDLTREKVINQGDLPDLEKFQEFLEKVDFKRLKKIDSSMVKQVVSIRTQEIPRLISLLSEDDVPGAEGGVFVHTSVADVPETLEKSTNT